MDQSIGAWKRTKEQLNLLLLCLVYSIILIVNNRNVLTDGEDERKYLQRKYNDL